MTFLDSVYYNIYQLLTLYTNAMSAVLPFVITMVIFFHSPHILGGQLHFYDMYHAMPEVHLYTCWIGIDFVQHWYGLRSGTQ